MGRPSRRDSLAAEPRQAARRRRAERGCPPALAGSVHDDQRRIRPGARRPPAPDGCPLLEVPALRRDARASEHGHLQRAQLERGADAERHVRRLAAADRDPDRPLRQVQRAVRFLIIVGGWQSSSTVGFKGVVVSRMARVAAAFGFMLFLPVASFAQATISGVVKDASGAVLPGVTVEASSPALIEKVRTTVTDGTGQYAIENLRPGLYAVKFTLAAFGTGAATSTLYLNPMGLQEITIDSGSNDASLNAGGVRTNYTLREGGNQFHGVVFAAYAPGSLQSNNLTQDLINRGLAAPNQIKANYDINPAFGGPILRDKVWFFGAARYNVTQDYVAGLFWNRNANNPNAWTYDPDPSRRVWNDQKQPDTQLRMSWQATARQKIGFTAYNTTYCFCPTDASATLSWEAGTRQSYPVQRLFAGDYTLPLTARLLIEGNGQFFDSQSNRVPWDDLAHGIVPVQEQTTGMKYRSPDSFRVQAQRVYTFRGALSYVTGAHAFKFGGSNRSGHLYQNEYDFSPVSYRLRNAVPNRITERALGFWQANVKFDLGLYAQDRWTRNKLTVNYGLRLDYFNYNYPEQHIGPTALAPVRNITFPAQPGIGTMSDLSPKFSAAYDLRGDGKTALKVSLNRYVIAMGPDVSFIQLANPARNLVTSATRTPPAAH